MSVKNKRLKRAAEKQAKATLPESANVPLREAAFLGLSDEAERPYVNLKYYHPDYECFSVWRPDKLRSFSEFCRKLSQMKWPAIYRSGGSVGHKTGLGYTVHRNYGRLPKHPELASLSPDLTWFELRVDQESRVHGFRVGDAFFLVFLDQDHRIYPQ